MRSTRTSPTASTTCTPRSRATSSCSAPFEVGGGFCQVAFVRIDDAVVEFMQYGNPDEEGLVLVALRLSPGTFTHEIFRNGALWQRAGGHTNSYHTHTREEAFAGIAAAGFRTVELTAVEGWTEHVDLDADTGELRARLAHYGLEPVVLSGHSDLTTPEGLALGIKAVRWCADYGLPS